MSLQTSALQRNPARIDGWSMDQVVRFALSVFIKRGNLLLITPRGSTFTLGDGTGKPIAVSIKTAAVLRRILLDPELALGECYMNGTLVMEKGSIVDLLALVLRQNREEMLPVWAWPQWMTRYLWRRVQQWNGRGRARQNVAQHYDVDERLYRLFLDKDQQYSCAYFEAPDQSLEDAQLAKKRHLAAKLLLQQPKKTVLDIGCGWGGLALYLAQFCNAQVTGITLSENQLRQACQRADANGLSDAVKFRLVS